MLFYKEQMKKAENADDPETKERCKALWENMSDKKKVVWINWAAEKETKYQVIYFLYFFRYTGCPVIIALTLYRTFGASN